MILLRCLNPLRCSTTHPLLRCCFFTSPSALPILQNSDKNLFTSNSQIIQLTRLGRVDEARRLFDDMIHRDNVSWNSIITGFLHNGRVNEARALFDSFVGKDVRTWTALLSGYAKNGQIVEARQLFDQMPERNIVSWNAMISAYVQNGHLDSARKLFEEMPQRNIASWNSIITGYCHSYKMEEASMLFNKMPEKNLVSWSVMISGYVSSSGYAEAWDLFRSMHRDGVLVDQSNLVVTLSAVTYLNDLIPIQSLHMVAVKTNFEMDVVVGTAILNAYTRNDQLHYANKLFDTMPDRNEFTWTTMISAFSQSGRVLEALYLYERVPEHTTATHTAMLTCYAQNGMIHEASILFDRISSPNMVTWNAMLTGYMQNGMIREASKIFRRMPSQNAVSWAAMIAGYAQNGMYEEALELLAELHRLGYMPSQSTFTSAFYACANIGNLEIGRQIHTLSIKTGSQFNPYIGNGLIAMYAKCKNTEDVSRTFSKMMVKDIVSWNSLIAGLSQNLRLEEARNIFEKMPMRDIVSWTTMISSYVQAGQGHEALELFLEMLGDGIKPNSSTLSSLLSACASLGSAKLGKHLHAFTFKIGLDLDVFVGNALISMYFKCGSLDAFCVFDEMTDKDIVTWNSLLAGAAQQGFGKEAVEIFEQMKLQGVVPNGVSFVALLCACSHAGLVEEGWDYFNCMSRDYGLAPLEPHYACMVDLLGRAGHLYEAQELIESMPIQPDSVVWGALLAACRIHQNVDLGRSVAEKLFQMDPQNPGSYILLSNIYASLGKWDKVEEVRQLMKDRGVTKSPGFSWIHIKNKLHSFVTGDRTHEQTKEIHLKLKELYNQLKNSGYMPDTNFVLHDVEDEQKENVLLCHSEKLAIAYALLNTPKGTPILVIKNLRICGDCHNFLKFASKVTLRQITIRDGNRFHHFRDGLCSCGDYW